MKTIMNFTKGSSRHTNDVPSPSRMA